ncbi:MAG: MBL fold metallo-hydrolase [Calditrichia bacterium]
MQIGKYDVHMIDTGRYRLDGGAMFGVVPQTLWKKEHPPDDKNRIEMALNTLLLVGNGHVILIDTGIGDKFSEKFAEIYAIDHSRHSLLKSLANHNIQPEDVTDVILTHLHFDHAGGATYYDADGALKLRFPNASHYVQKKQLEWAQRGFEKDRASYLKENIEPLMKSDNLKILDGPQKLFDGVEILLSDGHTIAQQLVLISGEEGKLLYAGDLIPLSAHVPLPWVMAYDLNPVKTIEEKRSILKRAVEENWMVFFEHDPRIYCATIAETEKGFRLKSPVRL